MDQNIEGLSKVMMRVGAVLGIAFLQWLKARSQAISNKVPVSQSRQTIDPTQPIYTNNAPAPLTKASSMAANTNTKTKKKLTSGLDPIHRFAKQQLEDMDAKIKAKFNQELANKAKKTLAENSTTQLCHTTVPSQDHKLNRWNLPNKAKHYKKLIWFGEVLQRKYF